MHHRVRSVPSAATSCARAACPTRSAARTKRCCRVYGVPYAPLPLDFEALFGRGAPRILEIGFGMGETTADIAAAHPENDYLALEVHTPGRRQPAQADRRARAHERAHRSARRGRRARAHDRAGDVRRRAHFLSRPVAQEAPPQAPADTAAVRRSLLASRLKPGGYVHVATDWEEYAQQILEVLCGGAAAAQHARRASRRAPTTGRSPSSSSGD